MSAFLDNSERNFSGYNYVFIYFTPTDEDAGWNYGVPDISGSLIEKQGSILYWEKLLLHT